MGDFCHKTSNYILLDMLRRIYRQRTRLDGTSYQGGFEPKCRKEKWAIS